MIRKSKSAALITAVILTLSLSILGIAFTSRSIQERNLTTRYIDSVRAFWLAEAAMAKGYSELMSSPSYAGEDWTTLASGSYRIIKNSSPGEVEIRAEGLSGSTTQVLTGTLALVAYPFENTVSVGGDISLSGALASISVYGNTRVSGSFSKSGPATAAWFENKVEGVDPARTTLLIPDYDLNGTADQFTDFVALGQEVIADYPADEVVYLQTDGTVNIFPDASLVGKKVIFVEGSAPGQGDVRIFFDATWQSGEDLTVISTGEITYVQPLQVQEDARLSAVSWDDYNEIAIFRNAHESVVYTHDDASYTDILAWGSTTGNIIANDDVSLFEVLTNQKYYYSDRAYNGDLPPGFDRLSSGSGVLSNQMSDWQEEYD
ncbi:MAG: hypothetical protein ABIE75_02635 [Candidatus Omnitrophota bacterium]